MARDVVAQFEMLTGEPIELFLDQDALEWGDKWRDKVDASLSTVAFFIPVLTPRYFTSAECRRELQFFARRASDLGVRELVLPLLYVDVPDIHREAPEDDLVRLVRDFNYVDWRELRFLERASGEYRRAISELAERLAEANLHAEEADVAGAAQRLAAGDDSDQDPGLIDRIAAAEEAMPAWSDTLERITAVIEAIGTAMETSTAELNRADNQGKGFAGRLSVARRAARDLQDPANEVLELGNDFAAQLHTVDSGIRAIIEAAPRTVEQDPEEKEAVCDFFRMVRQLSVAAHHGLGQLQQMVDAITPLERMSRDLRPPLRSMRQGLILMLEGREVSDDWVRLIDESPVQCASTSDEA